MAVIKQINRQQLWLVIISLLLLAPNFFDKDLFIPASYNHKEKFNSSLSYINSIGLLESYIDSIAASNKIHPASFEYVQLMEETIEHRFYHGFSHFSLQENWMAAAAGKVLKEDYACKVQPEEIMEHLNAACSQQVLVMMAMLRNKGISYRSLGLPHHYAMEVLINGNWYFFDANMEPGISREQRKLGSWKHSCDSLKKYYDQDRFPDLDYQFGVGLAVTTGTVNEVPAKNARLFHSVTGVLSKTLWVLPLLLLIFRLRITFRKSLLFFSLQRNTAPLALQA